MKKKYIANKCIVEENCLGQFCLHHIKTRGSGGSDSENNQMPLCAKHHTEVHKIGLNTFAKKYRKVEIFLKRTHEFDNFINKWLANFELCEKNQEFDLSQHVSTNL